jgi:RNA polymerase sigma-70 factor (ECF subfamily)
VTEPAERSDEELLEGLQRRDVHALEELYDRHHRLALALACRVVGDRESGEEIVQETFLAAWRQAGTYRPERGGARGWLLSIVRHRAIDRIRKTRQVGRLAELDDTLVDQRAPEAWQIVDANARRERISVALADLPREQREAIELAYYGGLTHQEISDLMGVPLGTVKGRMRLAMEKLRLALADLASPGGIG